MKSIVIKIGYIWAVILSLVILSNVNALNMIKTDKMTDMQQNVFVDPNIKLTKYHLVGLETTTQYLSDTEDGIIVEEIIKTIKTKTEMNSNDLYEILHKLNISDRSFYSGYVDVGGEHCKAIYFPLHPIRRILTGGLANFGFWFVVSWEVFGDKITPHCNINGRPIYSSKATKGLALMGFGSHYFGSPTTVTQAGSFSGLFSLISVSQV